MIKSKEYYKKRSMYLSNLIKRMGELSLKLEEQKRIYEEIKNRKGFKFKLLRTEIRVVNTIAVRICKGILKIEMKKNWRDIEELGNYIQSKMEGS